MNEILHLSSKLKSNLKLAMQLTKFNQNSINSTFFSEYQIIAMCHCWKLVHKLYVHKFWIQNYVF